MAKSRSDVPDEAREGLEGRRVRKSLLDPDRALDRRRAGDMASKATQTNNREGARESAQKAERSVTRAHRRPLEGQGERNQGAKAVSDRVAARRDNPDRTVEARRRNQAELPVSRDNPQRDAQLVRKVYVDTSITEIANMSASTRTIEQELRYKGPLDGSHSAYAHRQVQGQMGEVMAGHYLEQQGYRPLSPHGRSTEHGLDHIAWSPDGKRLFVGESKNHDSTRGVETGDRETGDRKGIWLDDDRKVRAALESQTGQLPKEEREKVRRAFDEGRVERGVFLYGDTQPSPRLVERARAEGWTIYRLTPRVKTYDHLSSRDDV